MRIPDSESIQDAGGLLNEQVALIIRSGWLPQHCPDRNSRQQYPHRSIYSI